MPLWPRIVIIVLCIICFLFSLWHGLIRPDSPADRIYGLMGMCWSMLACIFLLT